MFSDEKARARIVSADVLVSYHVSEKGFSLKEALRITERVYLGGGDSSLLGIFRSVTFHCLLSRGVASQH